MVVRQGEDKNTLGIEKREWGGRQGEEREIE